MYLVQNYYNNQWITQEQADTKELAEYLKDVYYPLEKTRIVRAS